MFIHIGNRVIISDKDSVGIFNTETIKMSEENDRFFNYIKPYDKTIIVDMYDNILTSKINSYTIIKRSKIYLEIKKEIKKANKGKNR